MITLYIHALIQIVTYLPCLLWGGWARRFGQPSFTTYTHHNPHINNNTTPLRKHHHKIYEIPTNQNLTPLQTTRSQWQVPPLSGLGCASTAMIHLHMFLDLHMSFSVWHSRRLIPRQSVFTKRKQMKLVSRWSIECSQGPGASLIAYIPWLRVPKSFEREWKHMIGTPFHLHGPNHEN